MLSGSKPIPAVYRTADPVAEHLSDFCGQRDRAAACGFQALCSEWRQGADRARRADAGCIEGRLAGGEFKSGRGHQGYLGT